MNRIFALYDSDSFYTTRFMEYFKRKKEFDFEFTAFTRKDSLEEYLSLHSIEILLLGNQDMGDGLCLNNVSNIYSLTETPDKDAASESRMIYRYQPARSLMYQIINDYNSRSDNIPVTNPSRSSRIISVFSPIQSSEAIIFTWSLGAMLSESKKTLVIMLDPLPVKLAAFADNDTAALTEFIYYLKEQQNSIPKLKTLLRYVGNMAYLAGITHAADIISLTREDAVKWAAELRNHTEYPAIIFYLGVYTEAASEMMNISDNVFITGHGESYEDEVAAVWSKQMEYGGIPVTKEKFINIHLDREAELGQGPISYTELRGTSAWNLARQNLNLEYSRR